MLISTKGRYAIRVLLDLADNNTNSYIPIKEIATRQELSLKYLEKIMTELAKNKLVKSVSGKGGGYCLTKPPAEYKIGDILRVMEGSLAPVSCLACNEDVCPKSSSCKTFPMWSHFNSMTNDFFDGITLENLLNGQVNF